MSGAAAQPCLFWKLALPGVAFPVYAQAQMSWAYTVAVSGVQRGHPMIEGIFDHAATMLDEHLVPLPVEIARERVDHAVERVAL